MREENFNKSEYSWAVPHIKGLNITPKIIAEIGSRDALDAIYLSRVFDSEVYVFEPDPINAEVCMLNIRKNHSKKLHFYELALSNFSGEDYFFSVDENLYHNRGASSFFEIDFNHRPANDPDKNREPVQKKIKVKVSRFEDLGLPAPSLVAMDVQGA